MTDIFPIVLDPEADRIAAEVQLAYRTPRLSPRLREIAGLVALGMSYAEIGKRLGIGADTVKVRMCDEVYPMMGVHNRWEFTRYWMQYIEERGDCKTCLLRMAHDEGAKVG